MALLVQKDVAEKPVHVFVIGVSRYLHLDDGTAPNETGIASGLEQLTSAARSASEFAAWVLENVPEERLARLYLNVAPSPGEELHPALRQRVGDAPTARRAEVVADWEAFYLECIENPDATAYIYAAGHGIQVGKEGAILLLEDFGAPRKAKLWAALDLVEMNKTLRGAEAAALQFWFVDCCRERAAAADYGVDEFRSSYVGFDEPEGLCSAAPIFFATLPRELAWARSGGVSLFNEALTAALRKDAATQPQGGDDAWCVTTASLTHALNAHVRQASGGHRQEVYLSGHAGTTNEVLHVFATPPTAQLKITLSPTGAQEHARAHIDRDDEVVVADAGDWPIERELPAGVYIVHVKAEPHYTNATRSVVLTPPSRVKEVELR